MKKMILSFLVFAGIVFISSCAKEKSATSYTDNVTCNEADDTANVYSGKIATLLSTNCAGSGCHNSLNNEAGRNFSNYASAKSGFDATALCTIYQDGGCDPMPRGASKLSADKIHDLTCWVKNDYPQ